MSKDTIYRQDAVEEIDEWIKAFLENGHKESAADACLIQDGIIQLPSVQPEIIRCKDCKHFWLGQCGLNGLTWSYDSFCSRAERQE